MDNFKRIVGEREKKRIEASHILRDQIVIKKCDVSRYLSEFTAPSGNNGALVGVNLPSASTANARAARRAGR